MTHTDNQILAARIYCLVAMQTESHVFIPGGIWRASDLLRELDAGALDSDTVQVLIDRYEQQMLPGFRQS